MVASNTISLSIGPHIDSNQIEEIADKVVNYYLELMEIKETNPKKV